MAIEMGTDHGTGTGAPAASDWFESLPPDLKVDKTVATYKGKPVDAVVRSLVDLNRLNGSAIHMPKADAPEDEKARWYNDIYTKLGRPESPDKYETKTPTLPDGTPWDAEGEKEFLSEAHKAGLNKGQAQKLLDWYGGRLTKGMTVRTEQMAATERALKQEWGEQYPRKLTLAQQAAAEIGGNDFVTLLEERGIANHPLVLRTLAAFGETLADQKLITGDVDGQSAADAKTRLDAILNDRNHPYHKGDPAAAQEVLELTRRKMGADGRKIVATFG